MQGCSMVVQGLNRATWLYVRLFKDCKGFHTYRVREKKVHNNDYNKKSRKVL